MSDVNTVSKDDASREQATASPARAPAPAPESLSSGTVSQRIRIEPTKREKTFGENRFNLETYGGWALLGNEAFSLGITESIGKSKDGAARFGHGTYKKFEGMFAGWSKHFERFKTPGLMRSIGDYATGTKGGLPRLPYLLFATIGGMLVVPFVKDREDRKGEIVRKYDRKHYGSRADTDPAMIEAHKEMDEAPRQSWGSLAKGRIVTVISAAIADFTFGWPDALSTKLFKNSPTWQKLCSLERLSNTFADWSSSKVKPKNEWLFKKVVGNGTWLLTLSSSLTVLFYFSSKLFAKKRDERIEQRQHAGQAEGSYREEPALDAGETALATSLSKAADKAAEAPRPQVSAAAHQATLAPAPELAQGA